MPASPDDLRRDALAIWHAGVDAVRPGPLLARALAELPPDTQAALDAAPRVLVVGAGKAGSAMAAAMEEHAGAWGERLEGIVNIPEGTLKPTRRVRLHPARPAGSNLPTEAGVAGAEEMLRLLASAGPDDVAVGLISGGGSALLPCPADGVTLADKLSVTKMLHAKGATIGEMNAVRKHLSRVKGGRLAEAFRGKLFLNFVISDVVGDPLDVIASGPTAPDPTTFRDASAALERYGLTGEVPAGVRAWLTGDRPETPKALPAAVRNILIGTNRTALRAAAREAERRGYAVLNLGAFVEGSAAAAAEFVAGVARSIRADGEPVRAPACVLVGGETTVDLGDSPGKGGRNQEFALAARWHLKDDMDGVAVLSGGTDGEDGPTDAAGAVAAADTPPDGAAEALRRHASYDFFARAGGLIRTGWTETNVADLRVILVG